MPESGTDTWTSAPFTSSSSSSSLSLLGALIHSFSGHTVLLHGPDVGSEANELGGSAQDSPCLLGPHGQRLRSDTEAPGEAGSSGCESHVGLSIRSGRVSWVHPRGCSPSFKVGEEHLPVSGRLLLPWWAGGTALDDQESASQEGPRLALSESSVRFFPLKTILSDFGSIAFCQKPTMIPRSLYTPREVTGCGAQHRPESVLP